VRVPGDHGDQRDGIADPHNYLDLAQLTGLDVHGRQQASDREEPVDHEEYGGGLHPHAQLDRVPLHQCMSSARPRRRRRRPTIASTMHGEVMEPGALAFLPEVQALAFHVGGHSSATSRMYLAQESACKNREIIDMPHQRSCLGSRRNTRCPLVADERGGQEPVPRLLTLRCSIVWT
jgi:hypothetical protein